LKGPAYVSKVGSVKPEVVEERIRSICLSLPEVSERESHGSPAFFAGKQFVALWSHGHHGREFPHLWCAAPLGAQEDLIAQNPERFFTPPYVGSRGWIGVRLDGEVDFEELEMLCEDAYRCVATNRQIGLLDSSST
jgi:hypothetical protein